MCNAHLSVKIREIRKIEDRNNSTMNVIALEDDFYPILVSKERLPIDFLLPEDNGKHPCCLNTNFEELKRRA